MWKFEKEKNENSTIPLSHAEESLPERDIQSVDGLSFPSALLQISDSLSSARTTSTAFIVIALHSVQPLQISNDFHQIFGGNLSIRDFLGLKNRTRYIFKSEQSYQVIAFTINTK